VSTFLQVADATVRFGPTLALDRISMTVDRGEILAVVGPSGSGKSTLLRVVAGLQALDSGTVHLDGRPLAGVPPHRRQVGLMFQGHALFPHRDVAGNVGFGPRMEGLDRQAVSARVAELLALVDLEGFDRRAVGTLSGGEQQRVALARALAAQPRLLLLDEPFGALDRPLRERLAADVQRITRQLGLTVVAVTHDHREALAVADRVAVLDGGRVLQTGPPVGVWSCPRSRRVAEVLALPNLLPVEVVAGEAVTPWGPLRADLPDGQGVLHAPVPALALALEETGGDANDDTDPVGTVVAAEFQGDRTLARVALDGGGEVEVTAPWAGPSIGARARVRGDRSRMIVLAG